MVEVPERLKGDENKPIWMGGEVTAYSPAFTAKIDVPDVNATTWEPWVRIPPSNHFFRVRKDERKTSESRDHTDI